ncbi:MAG: hypothetical protein HY781_09680 [Chloroflexi bacterium]|nr:hypothetical protein [Chloroflexota bacterium]
MKRLAYTALVFILALVACRQSSTPTAIPSTDWPPSIPDEYQSTCNDLNASLDAFIASLPQSGGQPPIFAAELSYANGNIGETLLKPEVLPLVRQQLDALQSMGVQGVVVAVSVPLLQPDYPRSEEYLEFFKQVAEEVHARGMVLLVESGPIFSGTLFSPVSVDWSDYDKASFLQARQDQLVTIANEIKPDHLQIANEPSTMAMLTGFEYSSEEYLDFIETTLEMIDKSTGILLGAGAGTWEDPAYLDGLMEIAGLDFIDIHIYPIGRDGNLLQQASEAARLAHANGKRVTISESWLYKVDSAELGELGGEFEMIYSRDAWSFFEPLDEKFIRALTLMARADEIEFVSFFWTRNFFTYLDYDQYRTLSAPEINRAINQASIAATESGALSPLGKFFKAWISEQSK